MSTYKRMKLEPYLILGTKNQFKKVLNIKPETVDLLEENIGKILHRINLSNILSMILRVLVTRTKKTHLELYHTKARPSVLKRKWEKWMKGQPTERKKAFRNHKYSKTIFKKMWRTQFYAKIKKNFILKMNWKFLFFIT